MDAARYRQVKDVLMGALGLQGADRRAWLDEACAGDAALRAEVEDLLAREGAPSTIVDAGLPAAAAVVQALAAQAESVGEPASLPDSIGPYRITGLLGEGGMGTVYRGEQDAPIRREVAVKVLRRGLDTARVLERFAWERRTLERLDHPHIARILDAGTAQDGRPYVVLELVEGRPVTQWCEARALPVVARVDLMIDVCRAVQHAHDRGVLHRDLKPGNVLVREVDGRPVPCVIDFGIAKALDPTDGLLTMTGLQLGTPAYMSPEQRAGDAASVDVRSDVYALGVMLYELLAGVRPFADGAPAGEAPPPPPSSRRDRAVRGDLDHICLMAVRHEPQRRYVSAGALADDLERFRRGRPVLASGDAWSYRLRKAARRHPAATAAAMALAVFVVSGAAFLVWHSDRLEHERTRALAAEAQALKQERTARGTAEFLENLLTDIDPEQGVGAQVTASALLERGAERLETELADQPLLRARLLRIIGQSRHSLAEHEPSLELVDRALVAAAQEPDTVAAMAELAELHELRSTVLYDMGRYAASEAADRVALDLYRRLHGEGSREQVIVMADLAMAMQAQSRVDEAVDVLRESIRLGLLLGEPAAQDVAWSRNNLGYLLYQKGAWAEAVEVLNQALDAQRRVIPDDNIELAGSLNNLGGVYSELERFDQAERLLTEALDMYRRIYDGRHPAVARGMISLGGLALRRGDLERGAKLIEPGAALALELLATDHPHAAAAQLSLARLRRDQGRAAEAEKLFRHVVATRERVLGPDHWRTRDARGSLAEFLLHQRRWAEARALLRDLLPAEEARLPADHPGLNELRSRLAEAEIHLDGVNEARALLQNALPRLEQALGPEHSATRRARELLAAAG